MTRADEIAALDHIVITNSPIEKSIRLENLRAELDKEGFTIVKTAWLARLNAVILKRGIEL